MPHAPPITHPHPHPTQNRLSPAFTQPRYSPDKIAAVIKVTTAQGCDADQMLLGTGLTLAQLQDPDTLTSTAQLYQVLGRGLLLSGDASLGWKVGQQLRISSYGMYGYALLCAPDLRAVLDAATRYHLLANPLVPIRYTETEDELVWLFPAREEMPLPKLGPALYRVLIEMQMAIYHSLARDVMGPDCQPSQAVFSWAEDGEAQRLASRLQCPLAFSQAVGELRYSKRWLDLEPQFANTLAAVQTSRTCAQLLQAMDAATPMTRRVYDELTRLPGQFPDTEAIAQRLGMTGRTLRRHLKHENISYAELLSRVRLALAQDYLCTTRMHMEDIAQALGFSDARTFRHAFLRWTGRTPTHFRRMAR
jgi:AraC-like DNA-binding protein